MIFPMLMLVIVTLHAITAATRTEHAVQTVADRAAQTASLCCLHVEAAQDAAQRSVAVSAAEGPTQRLRCTNDAAADAAVLFTDVGGSDVPELDSASRPNQVPSGGRVAVRVDCELPPSVLGGFSLLGSSVSRSAIGIAAIDPYRHRPTVTTPTPP